MRRAEIERAFRGGLRDSGRAVVHAPDAGRNDPYTRAAVLCPIVERDSALLVILVRRSERLRLHAGQIAFPGGRVERGDRDSLAAALREAGEEISLQAPLVEPIGTLPAYRTGTGYEILPHVAFVNAAFAARPDGGEVEEAFEVPLAHLLDPRNLRLEQRRTGGRMRHYYAIDWNGRTIWGATAAILKSLADKVLSS